MNPPHYSSSASDPYAQLRHDLRTPVNQILGYSEMLQEDAEASGQDSCAADLGRIQLAARHLLALIADGLGGASVPGATGPATPALSPALLGPPRLRAGEETPPDGDSPIPLHGRVLVVDDDENNRDLLARRVERHGLSVETAENGRQALQMAGSGTFDLVLLDLIMPELDGRAVLLQMKSAAETRHIPVIMISALDELNSVIQCIEAGAEDYLPKPFNPTLLRARIAACLEKKSLRDLEQRHLRTIEETQLRLTQELTEAAHYVQSILPPPCEHPLGVDWRYQPSTELGGDAFGYHWIDPDHFAVYLLDVCGHGVGASLLSVTAINVIRSASLPGADWRDPGAVLTALNGAFPMERQNNMYFTLWYGVYHAPTRILRHASGGHPPALLLKPASGGATTSERLRSPGMIVGGFENFDYQSQSCLVPPGATLLVFCDGCYEITEPDGEMMAFETFEHFVEEHGARPDGLARLLTWLQDRHGNGPLDDDFSIVRIQF